MVADWVATKTLSEAMAVFEAHEVAAAPVYDITDLVADEQLAHREVFVSVDDQQLGCDDGAGPGARVSRRRRRQSTIWVLGSASTTPRCTASCSV